MKFEPQKGIENVHNQFSTEIQQGTRKNMKKRAENHREWGVLINGLGSKSNYDDLKTKLKAKYMDENTRTKHFNVKIVVIMV